MIIAMDISQAESFGVNLGQRLAVVRRTSRTVVRITVTVSGMEVPTGASTLAHGVSNATMYHV